MEIKPEMVKEIYKFNNIKNEEFSGSPIIEIKNQKLNPNKNLKIIKERINSGFYDSDEIIEKVVQAILLDIKSQK